MKNFTLLVAALVSMSLNLGCKSGGAQTQNSCKNERTAFNRNRQMQKSITKIEAEDIALHKAALLWKGKRLKMGPTGFFNGHWSVDVWYLPETPGGFVSIEIAENGKIVGIMPGE